MTRHDRHDRPDRGRISVQAYAHFLLCRRLTNVAADKHFSEAALPPWFYCACS